MANSSGYKNLTSGKYGSAMLQKQTSGNSNSTGNYSYSWKFHLLETSVPKSVLTLEQYFQPITKSYNPSIIPQKSSINGLEASLSSYKQASSVYSNSFRLCSKCFGELDTRGNCKRCR